MPRSDGSIVIDTRILEDGFRKGTASLAAMSKRAGVAIGAGIGVAAAALTAYTVSAVKAAEADRSADKRVESVAKSMGLFGDEVGTVTKRLTDLATATALQTGLDDEAIKTTQAKLLTFKELAKTADDTGGAFDRATQAALDLQAAGFGSMEQNATQLGKALQDPIKGITALARSGVTFTKAEKDRIKALVESNRIGEAQDVVLKAIESQVGGTAAATAKASERMGIAFGELQESAGFAFLPLVDKFLPEVMNGLQALQPVIESTFGGLADMMAGDGAGAAAFSEGLSTLLTGAVTGLTEAMPMVTSALMGILSSLAQTFSDPAFQQALVDAISTTILIISEALPTLLPMFVEAFMQITVMLAERLGQMAPVLIPILVDALFRMVDVLYENAPAFGDAAWQLMNGLLIGIRKSIPKAVATIWNLGAAMLRAITEFFGIRSPSRVFAEVGADLVRGLWQGITDKFGWLTAQLRSFASNVTDKLKAFFKIKSPSRLFADEIGVNLALGVGVGFARSAPAAFAAMRSSVASEMGRFSTAVGPTGAAAVAASSTTNNTTINFRGRVRTYSEMLRAQRDIERGLAF